VRRIALAITVILSILAGASVVLTVAGSSAAPSTVGGLRGDYFSDSKLTNLKLSRIDPTIDFDWSQSAPAPDVGPHTFSVRWTGKVTPRFSETYTFFIKSDGGVKLWLDGRQIIDDRGHHSLSEQRGTLALQAGQAYDLKLEYVAGSKRAMARLLWSSKSQPKQIVPADQLTPPNTAPQPPTATATRPAATATAAPTATRPAATATAAPTATRPAATATAAPTATRPATATPVSNPPPTTTAPTWWKPTPGQPIHWHWQLSQDFVYPRDVLPHVTVYDIDGEQATAQTVAQLHALGPNVKVICYIDAGVYETYRSDASRFPKSVIGKADEGWDGSFWLDIRQTEILLPIMGDRMQHWCKDKGFDAVEPDETEVWSNNSGFPITKAQNNAYNIQIAAMAHELGLSVGLKGNTTEAPELWSYFDWTLNEQCWQYRECDNLSTSFLAHGKAVFNIEYDVNPDCATARAWHMNSARRDLNLVGPTNSGYRYAPCTPDTQDTW
jgi:hypothetical protein